jgi:hypothetical protein
VVVASTIASRELEFHGRRFVPPERHVAPLPWLAIARCYVIFGLKGSIYQFGKNSLTLIANQSVMRLKIQGPGVARIGVVFLTRVENGIG